MSTTEAANGNGGATGDLSGCAALVTGASSGIGAATALAIARQGGSVALVARRAERLEELTAAIAAQGGTSLALAADLREAAQAEAVVEQAVSHFGRLDVLVNSAGYGARNPVLDSDPADWDMMIDVNLRALIQMSRSALPHLLRAASEPGSRGVADLVNIGSVAGRLARKDNSVYSATKHAVGGFSESLRMEVTGRGVRVGLIEPGMTLSEMTQTGQSAAGLGMPEEKWLRVEDIARSVIFMITQPPHAAVNEIMVRPTAQEH
ncbi:SDR family NAD(P)-dependent oxidoreductase [Streptomyces sp. 150FB]|uniref:SDR family oxidoreductase n=1 Tax=Streptomyces sp. 150FB TaxID=1576605 RepID=UPI000695D7D7|nr:SDR family NAD(P)-dependent oxidoreductase [Streptomyces sp. 150FB]